jgi:hypothetical protein
MSGLTRGPNSLAHTISLAWLLSLSQLTGQMASLQLGESQAPGEIRYKIGVTYFTKSLPL